ncbi:xylulokinase [Friedmanniella luteola]|uniref:Xylulose kinase n=1 Tax=Friedmanniella luteola TaxID=546871 RepID=A0A1H1QS54_9ACTN|nr:xylulokinase [Friedmanniella luteola]SDS26301.1 xylulokinase [Friedmanniella luteola]
MTYVAGVDSSTQSVKVVVCDAETGAVVRSGRAAHPDGTEVTAAAWWDAYRSATADPALLDGVEALAVGGQQHGMVTLDESGELVRDALLWNDNRSARDARDLIDELGGAAAWADAVGTVPVASMTVTKLRWLARAEPEHAARTHAVVLPHDWLTWQLGGRSFDPVTDRGDASGTCYFDATADRYRDDLVRRAIGHDLALPRVARPDEVVGHTPEGIAIAAGTGDNMAAGLGLGLREQEAVVSLGTSGTAFTRSTAQTHEPTGTVAGFADATGAFLPLVCTLNGARNLVAAAELLGVSLDELSRLALSAEPGSGGLTFLPYLEGERTPPLPDARGELLGLTLRNMTPANVARATIEGVLWSLAYGVQVLQEQTGPVTAITLTGGASQSDAVRRIAPAVFGLPIRVTDTFESVAVGAARQAAWALTGALPDWPVPVLSEHEPTTADQVAATELSERYRAVLLERHPSTGAVALSTETAG